MTTDPITRLNAALEGRYRVEREIGEGMSSWSSCPTGSGSRWEHFFEELRQMVPD